MKGDLLIKGLWRRSQTRLAPWPRMLPGRYAVRGFTLLEILIALVIIAVALSAATRATHVATDGTYSMKQRLLATWVAQNRLAERRSLAAEDWPDPGTFDGEAEQAGVVMRWQETVTNTPNPAFRRVEVKVYGQDRSYALATLAGYLVEPQ